MTMFGASDYSASVYDGPMQIARAAFPGAKAVWTRVAHEPDLIEADAGDSRVPHAFRSLERAGGDLLAIVAVASWLDSDGHRLDPHEILDHDRIYRLSLSWQDH